MKRACVLLSVILGCARAVAPKAPASNVHITATVTCDTEPATHDGLCEGVPRVDDGLDDVMFGACDAFVPRFEKALATSCASVVPSLASALALDDSRDETGIYKHRAARDERLGVAALSHVQARCPGHFRNGIAGDDWGRSLWELEGDDWHDCIPDRDLVEAYTTVRETWVDYVAIDTPVGHWLFAIAIAPKLTPRGVHALRKFLVCERIERAAGESAPSKRLRFRKYLLTDP